jgi:hypothetical protein
MLLYILLLLISVHSIGGQKSKFINIKTATFLGPWTVGKNELDGNPAYNIDYLYNIYRNTHPQQTQTSFISELVTGGYVSWIPLQSLTQNRHAYGISLHNVVDFNRIVQSLFSVEVQEVQGWIVGEFVIKKKGTYTINCKGMLTCFVDDVRRMMAGDMFRTGRIATPVLLMAGTHVLYGELKFKGQTQIEVNIKGPAVRNKKQAMSFHSPLFTPDLLSMSAGHPDKSVTPCYLATNSWISIPVTNRGSLGQHVKFKIMEKDAAVEIIISSAPSSMIFPGQHTSINVQLSLKDPTSGLLKDQETPLIFHLIPYTRRGHFNLHNSNTTTKSHSSSSSSRRRLRWKKQPLQKIKISCRCRTSRQSFIFTFLDHDGSVARAAAIPPLPAPAPAAAATTTTAAAGVLLSMHGTGVDVSMQADSYKYKPKESANDDAVPYIFGIPGMWTLAPTRDGAHSRYFYIYICFFFFYF